MRLIDFKQIKHLWVWYTKNKNKNREESGGIQRSVFYQCHRDLELL